MKNELARVKNIRKVSQAYEALVLRETSIPGMGLITGATGAGKSASITWLAGICNAVMVRATATVTMTGLLGAILQELGSTPLYRASQMLTQTVDKLVDSDRPLFIDEADYLLRDWRMLETLRDIHDLTSLPVVLVGMKGIQRKLAHREQLTRRISQFVELDPLDIADARLLADTCTDIRLEDDLLTSLHKEAKGNVGLMIVGLSRIESYAKTRLWKAINASQWGNRKLFLNAKAG